MVRFKRFLWLILSVVSYTKILAGQSSEPVGYNPSAGKYAFSLHFRSKNGNNKLNTTNNSNSSWNTWGRCWPSCSYDPNGPILSCQWLCMCLGPCYVLFFFPQFLAQILVQNGSRMARVMNSPSAWPRCGVITNVGSKDPYGPIQQI